MTWFYRLGERFYQRLEQTYGKVLQAALNNRKKVVLATLAIFLVSLLPMKYISSELFPDTDTGMVSISMAQDESTRLEESAKLARRVSKIFKKLVPEMTQRYAFCGETEEGIGTAVGMEEGPNIVEGGAKLVRKKYRHRSSKEVAAAVRKELEKIPGIERMKVIATTPMKQMMLGGGKQIEVEIVGHDLNVTRQLAEKIKKIFLKTPGAVDVTVSFKRPRQEIHVFINRKKAASLGITAAAVAQVLRSSYYGFEATKYREAGEDFDIFVRLNKPGRSSLDTIGELDIPSLNEQVKTVKLKNIARIVQATGPVQIDRKNRERIITVGADTFGRSLGEVKADVERALKNLDIPPGVTVEFGGEAKEQRKAFRDLYALLIIGGILVVMVIVSQFESFRTPLAVIFAIPFTFTGVILALWLTGLTLNMMSFMAVILLIGVVVNNAIVLLDYADVLRSRGIALMDAIVQAGIHRLRPILMTTFTCLFGMLPLAVSRGEGAEMWQPFGVTVIGGLLASTVIGLIIVPIMYSYFSRKEITPERG
ncbi:MAG: efflux RND transporter permease subunit [Planctomycetes bacterium]|nr:efflux RND transporter permease subunit [Planctomycetota bacterium]